MEPGKLELRPVVRGHGHRRQLLADERRHGLQVRVRREAVEARRGQGDPQGAALFQGGPREGGSSRSSGHADQGGGLLKRKAERTG